MNYDPAAHEPLTATEWDKARVEEAIAGIVADAESGLVGGAWRDPDASATDGSAQFFWRCPT